LAVWCLAVAWGTVVAVRSRTRMVVVIACGVVAVGAPLALAVLRIDDLFDERNVIAGVPLAAAIAAPAMLRLRAVPLIAYLALATLTSVWVQTDWRYENSDWRGAIARVESIDPGAPVLVVTPISARVARTYLHRSPAPARGLVTRYVWIIVEPHRVAGDRAFVPAPAPTLAGFTAMLSLQDHAFELILARAAQPTLVKSDLSEDETLFAPGPT
jgi:hypothetical protein